MNDKASNLIQHKARRAFTRLIMLFSLVAILPACGGSAPVEIAVGSPAPAFSLPTSDGGSVALSDYLGKKPTLLYFHMALG